MQTYRIKLDVDIKREDQEKLQDMVTEFIFKLESAGAEVQTKIGWALERLDPKEEPILDHETKALMYAEKHGIIEYEVKGYNMIYYTNYPMEHITYRCTIDLDSMKETRETMQQYYKKGNYNLCM